MSLVAFMPLDMPIISFGRSTNNILAINDHKVSRYHGEISLEEGVYVIRDLGSTNGTIVDGARVSEASLQDGSIIRIGETTLTYKSR